MNYFVVEVFPHYISVFNDFTVQPFFYSKSLEKYCVRTQLRSFIPLDDPSKSVTYKYNSSEADTTSQGEESRLKNLWASMISTTNYLINYFLSIIFMISLRFNFWKIDKDVSWYVTSLNCNSWDSTSYISLNSINIKFIHLFDYFCSNLSSDEELSCFFFFLILI